MAEELNRSEVMRRRFELDEQISIMQNKHKVELAPLVEEMGLCERFIADSMIKAGEQQFKIAEGHQTYFTTQTSCKVGGWDELLAFIQKNEAWELLNHAVNKTSVTEYIDANNAPPPGVSYESRKVLAWRRGKA